MIGEPESFEPFVCWKKEKNTICMMQIFIKYEANANKPIPTGFI